MSYLAGFSLVLMLIVGLILMISGSGGAEFFVGIFIMIMGVLAYLKAGGDL